MTDVLCLYVMNVTCVLMSSLVCYSLFVCVFIAQARILLH